MEPKIAQAVVAHVIRRVVNNGSSSESDDDDFVEELLLFRRCSHNKIEEYVQKTVMSYSLDHFRSHFRLTKSAVEVVKTYNLYITS